MKRITRLRSAFAGMMLLGLWCAPPQVTAADWPQFMRDPEHAGDAAEEALRLPLGLATCVKLDEVVTTARAVVGGWMYVENKMVTAYCTPRKNNRVLWKTAPEGD